MIDFPEAGAACRIGRGEAPSSQVEGGLASPGTICARKYLFQCTNPAGTPVRDSKKPPWQFARVYTKVHLWYSLP
jgi:hypothetical protein